MLDRSVSLVIDSHLCQETTVETGVSQGSPVSPVLFAIYLSEVFKEVKQEVEKSMATLFVNDCG